MNVPRVNAVVLFRSVSIYPLFAVRSASYFDFLIKDSVFVFVISNVCARQTPRGRMVRCLG